MQIINKNQVALSRIATVIIFLALIRCNSEPFRLDYYGTTVLTFEAIKPFLIGALITAVALFSMTILSYFAKHKLIIAISILTTILLLVMKKSIFDNPKFWSHFTSSLEILCGHWSFNNKLFNKN